MFEHFALLITMKKIVWVNNLGIIDYLKSWEYKKYLFQQLINKKKCRLSFISRTYACVYFR